MSHDRWPLSVVQFAVFVAWSGLVLGHAELTFAQTSFGQGERQQAPGQTQSPEQVRGSSGGRAVDVIPTISISERYDSNLLRSTSRQLSDFVTDIRPGARVNYSSDMVDAMMTGGALSAIHVNNPGLNYVGGFANVNATLDKISERMIRGFGLRVQEAISYYPEQPAFVTPELPDSDFTRGIQARRNNSITNVSTIQGTYTVNPLLQVNSSYSFQTRRFLGQPDTADPDAAIRLFNITTHTVTAGPNYYISPNNLIGVAYAFRQPTFEPSSSGFPGAGGASTMGRSLAIHGASATWRSVLSRELTAEISPGVSIITATPNDPIWTMRASLQWQGQQKSAALTYSRGVFPSFVGQAALMVSNVVTGTFSYELSDRWNVMLGGNYAVNTRAGAGVDLRFESISVNGTLRYMIYQGTFVTLAATHNEFKIDQPSQVRQFDREVVVLTLSSEWN